MRKGKNIMRFICFSLFLAILAFNDSCYAQMLQAPQATIQSRIYVPTEAEFQKMSPEAQRAFQSAGIDPVAEVKQAPHAAESGNQATASVNQKTDVSKTKEDATPAPASK